MNSFLSICLIVIMTNCQSKESFFPYQLGEDVDIDSLFITGEVGVLTSSSSINEGYKVDINGIPFNLVLKEKRLVFVSVNSAAFQTPEGVKVNQLFTAIKGYNSESLVVEKGWGTYFELESGWKAARLSTENRVEWLFMRLSDEPSDMDRVIDKSKSTIKNGG